MLEWIRVEGAGPLFPHTCRCGSATDLLDTHMEDHTGRIYQCRACIAMGARVLGMIEGDRHAELMQADTTLRRTEKALEEQAEQIERQRAELDVRARRITQLEANVEQMRGREKQREYLAGQLIESAKELAATRDG